MPILVCSQVLGPYLRAGPQIFMVRGATMTQYADLDFGLASAEQESQDRPELIRKGFLDVHGHLKELSDADKH